jgi:transposase
MAGTYYIFSMKKDGRSLPHELLETYRMAAVRLRRQGVGVNVIAESFRVRREAVSRWISAARKFGIRYLCSRKAPGPQPRLSEDCFKELIRILKHPASEMGYATDLWSGNRVRHLVKKQWKISYHAKHMPRFLRRLGMVMRFPERRALEQDPVELRKWKKKRFPEILDFAKKKKALLFYADEALISLIPYVGKTWTFPNARPIVRVSGKRGKHVGITGAINAQGRFCFELTQDEERFTARVFLRFVRKLHREFPRRHIVLIVDGAPTHKAKIVKEFEKKSWSWLRLEILPAYSPELNPSEECWNFIKTKRMNGSMATDKEKLRQETVESAQSLKKNKAKIRSFF